MNANEWTVEYPPLFTDIDWNVQSFMPLEYEQKTAYPPFQRRRSSSVDLPLNPLYSNAGRIQSQPTIQEEPAIRNWSPLEFNTDNTFTQNNYNNNNNNNNSANNEYPLSNGSPLSSTSTESNVMTSPQPPTTFFPELHRTSYNNMLGKHLIQHQKRRRSSSVPPRFQPRNFASSNLSNNNSRPGTPLVFAQLQVTDPRPVHHPSKAAKVDARPVPIERVHKPQPAPVTRDPAETKKKMDEDLIQLNFEDITVAELKDMLRERGYPTTGKKAVLTDRLKDAQRHLINSRVTASPAIQGFADMSLNSPVMGKLSTSLPNESIHPALNNFSKDDLDMNALFADTDAFPPWNSDETLFKFTDWDQDQLDSFLTEL